MKSLLLKDLYNISHNAKSMLVVLIFLAIAIVPTSGPIAYMVMCAVLCSMMIVTTFTFDDTCNWTPYALILPIGRRQIVLAKYAALAVFCTVGILFGLVASGVGAFLTSDGPFAAGGPVETLVGVLMGWSISFVMGSTAIPLVFRFGAEKARILIVAAFVIPAALVIAIAGVVTVALSGAAGVSGEALPDTARQRHDRPVLRLAPGGPGLGRGHVPPVLRHLCQNGVVREGPLRLCGPPLPHTGEAGTCRFHWLPQLSAKPTERATKRASVRLDRGSCGSEKQIAPALVPAPVVLLMADMMAAFWPALATM